MVRDTVPEVLAGRYEVDLVLGEGGMAQVFRGTDRVLGRTVAVKVLAPQFARDETSVARFRREAQSAASLNHPNVVSVFDTGSEDGIHWIVMEYVEGRTLKDVIREEGPLPPERAVEIARSVSHALATAHEKGLVHRDVKPANIMITPNGETKVMDFGIARAVTSTGDPTLTRTGFVMGTAAYLSPEQAQGKPVDARSDIYSLGCVMYEALTGRPPFEADSPVAVATKHMSEEPEPPSRVNPEVSRELEAVVARAMRKDPDQRYQDARQLADDLSRAVTGELPLAGGATGAATEPVPRPGGDTRVLPTAVPEPIRESFRRSPWLPTALIGGLLALLALVAAFVLLRGETEAPTGRQRPPETTPAESPTPDGPPSVTQAFAALTELVNQGVLDGVITQEAAGEIFGKLGDIQNEWIEGKIDEAQKKIDELHGTIDDLAEKGEISDPAAVSALHQALDDLAEAMGRTAPSGEGGEEDSPGRSGEKGKGKGNEGDDD